MSDSTGPISPDAGLVDRAAGAAGPPGYRPARFHSEEGQRRWRSYASGPRLRLATAAEQAALHAEQRRASPPDPVTRVGRRNGAEEGTSDPATADTPAVSRYANVTRAFDASGSEGSGASQPDGTSAPVRRRRTQVPSDRVSSRGVIGGGDGGA